jgi:hypothetical protein
MGDPDDPDATEHTVGATQMTDMATTYRPELDESQETLVAPATSSTETQALITEQEVLLSTAAALPPAKPRRWNDTVHAVGTAVRAMFAAPEKPATRQHYPKRYVWLDNALMSREMDRL